MSLFDCGVPRDDDARGRRVLSAPGIARRLSEPGDPVDHHRLHVHRRRQLRAAGARRARPAAGPARRRGVSRLHRRRAGRRPACSSCFFTPTGMPIAEAVRHAAFQVVSIITTTGYASVDFALWSAQAQVVLLALMFIGGSVGSAAGGPKVVRHVLMAKFTLRELRQMLHPRAVLPVKLGGRVVPEETMREVVVFMLFYILTFAVGAAIVIAARRRSRQRHQRHGGADRQRRPRVRQPRSDGALRRPASDQQDRPDPRDVDWAARSPDRAGALPARSLACRTVARRLKLPVFARPSRLRDIFRA